jgi:hypothetical protein
LAGSDWRSDSLRPGRLICRSAQIRGYPVQPPSQKYFCFHLTQITSSSPPSRPTHKGRFAIVTNVRLGCGGRGCAFDEMRWQADGEVVWS